MIQLMVAKKEESQPITGLIAKIIEYRFKCVHCGAIHVSSTFDKKTFRTFDRMNVCGRDGCMHYLPDVERLLMTLSRRLRYTTHKMKREPMTP